MKNIVTTVRHWWQIRRATEDHQARAWKQQRWLIWETLAHPFDSLFGPKIRPELESILPDGTTRQNLIDMLSSLERKLDSYATDDLRRMRSSPARRALEIAREFLPSEE